MSAGTPVSTTLSDPQRLHASGTTAVRSASFSGGTSGRAWCGCPACPPRFLPVGGLPDAVPADRMTAACASSSSSVFVSSVDLASVSAASSAFSAAFSARSIAFSARSVAFSDSSRSRRSIKFAICSADVTHGVDHAPIVASLPLVCSRSQDQPWSTR